MSRFVLVEFEDDQKAEAFVAGTEAKSTGGAGYRISGVYQRPNRWCGCANQIAGVTRPVSRGRKFGWWICGWCGKPRPGTQQLVNLYAPGDPGLPQLHSRRYNYRSDLLSVFEVPNGAFEEDVQDVGLHHRKV